MHLELAGGELTGIAKEFTAHTNRNVATSGCTRGTGLKSSGGGTPGTFLPCRTYSTHGRSYRTSGRPRGATSRRADIRMRGPEGLRLFSSSSSRSNTTEDLAGSSDRGL